MFSACIALVCAVLLFVNWNPEPLFQSEQPLVTIRDIEQNRQADFTGLPAGEDIPRLYSAADFTEISFAAEYVTVEPVGIVQTDVSSLKPWVARYNPHTYHQRTTTGSRRAQVKASGFDLLGYYLPYYLLELPNHTYIVAQIPPESAERLKSGEHIVLPIGRKVGMTDTARKHLSAICEGYGADMDGVFYAFDNQWQEEHHLIFLLFRFGAAALLWLVLSVGLTLLANGFLQKNAKSGKENRDC